MPAQDARRLKPLTACLVMQLMTSLARKKSDRGFAFYLDELCNADRIPHYAEHISLVRSQGLALIQVIQDFGQLRREYGRDDAATILANSTTKVFFPGVGKEEATYASELLGDKTMKTTSYTRRNGSYSDTHSYTRRRLMTADEIRRMPRGQALVVYSNVAPMIVRNTPYFKQRSLRNLANVPPASPAA